MVQCSICQQETDIINKVYSDARSCIIEIAICQHGHMTEVEQKHNDPETIRNTCPICTSIMTSCCNCENTTRYCDNGHSWMKCRKCGKIHTSDIEKHIVFCDICDDINTNVKEESKNRDTEIGTHIIKSQWQRLKSFWRWVAH